MRHIYRCPACRTRKFSFRDMLAHQAASGHKLCNCGGYHYAHRPGSPCCEVNPMAAVQILARFTDDQELLAEVAAACAWDEPGRASVKCPF